jgi:hypothetical protein
VWTRAVVEATEDASRSGERDDATWTRGYSQRLKRMLHAGDLLSSESTRVAPIRLPSTPGCVPRPSSFSLSLLAHSLLRWPAVSPSPKPTASFRYSPTQRFSHIISPPAPAEGGSLRRAILHAPDLKLPNSRRRPDRRNLAARIPRRLRLSPIASPQRSTTAHLISPDPSALACSSAVAEERKGKAAASSEPAAT